MEENDNYVRTLPGGKLKTIYRLDLSFSYATQLAMCPVVSWFHYTEYNLLQFHSPCLNFFDSVWLSVQIFVSNALFGPFGAKYLQCVWILHDGAQASSFTHIVSVTYKHCPSAEKSWSLWPLVNGFSFECQHLVSSETNFSFYIFIVINVDKLQNSVHHTSVLLTSIIILQQPAAVPTNTNNSTVCLNVRPQNALFPWEGQIHWTVC